MNLHTARLVSFPSSECVDEIIHNWANYREYEYDVDFLQSHTLTILHFMKSKGLPEKLF